MIMRVVTVDGNKFAEMCRTLKEDVISSGYSPDTVVAVARGGVYLAQKMFGENFFTVSCAREGTGHKQRWVGAIVRLLPDSVNIALRKLEHRILGWIDKSAGHRPREVTMTPDLDARLKGGGRKVLVVDDAVDSGRSLRSVLEAIRAVNPANEIRTAVITVTRDNPVTNPDYALYRNRTLVRFPWAEDVRN